MFLFTPMIVGGENIPKSGRIVLAGNHTIVFDCLLFMNNKFRDLFVFNLEVK